MANLLLLKRKAGFYQIPVLEKLGVRAVITTRAYNMAFEDDLFPCDRRRAYSAIEMSWSRLVCPSQAHGNHVVFITPAHKGRGSRSRKTAIADTDALITNSPHLPIGILTADCLPIFIFDRDRMAAALIHAGWRGIHKGIVFKTVELMVRRCGVEPSDLIVILGPSIRSCCYEVGGEFLSYFDHFSIQRGKKIYFDLQGAAISQLSGSGVREDCIYDSLICTSCHNSEFFSYRKEGTKSGRSMFAVEIL